MHHCPTVPLHPNHPEMHPSTMDCPRFDIDEFLSWFPVFSDEEVWKRPFIQGCGNRAMMHITHFLPHLPMKGMYRQYALFLMTAHLATLDAQDDDAIANGEPGGAGGVEFKATIGSVSIERTKPNSFTTDDLSYWLNQTKYGRELLAYLDTRAPIGVFINGPQDSVRDLI